MRPVHHPTRWRGDLIVTGLICGMAMCEELDGRVMRLERAN